MASSSTSSIRKNFKYHVFISFRGEDTRTTFVDHLYHSLKRSGIHAFRDNEELEKGKRIDELFKAIEESKFFIIVFSKHYASSSWCLKELAKIMECQDEIERIAYPLFHDVEPTDIRKQSGPVGRAIAKHMSDEQIKTWKKALEDAGNLVGWDLKKIADGHEAEAISLIVQEISDKLRSIYLSKDENLVGMKSRMQDVKSSLGKGLNDEVRMIGIKGMGGIGKTTLASTIYQEISSQFEGKSFVENVREASKVQGGLLSLQQQVLKDVFGMDNVKSVSDAISTMKMIMPLKKVLLVLDDVDHKDQLGALAGDWFKGGSRIIITTRDEQVLRAHRVNRIHNIKCLPKKEAISLFNRYAFERCIPDQGYKDLSLEVVKYAAGLPLTLKVLGSFLIGKEKAAWINTLKRLETIPVKETLDILEISYDGLENDQKEIFLDAACFMKGMSKEEVVRILESRGFYAIIGLQVLEKRCLINISKWGSLEMHDSIQELGRNIVRRDHPHEPNKHSRLWIPDEIEEILSDDMGTKATTCIRLESTDLSPEVIMKGLRKLKNLSFLQISWRDDDCPCNNWPMFDQDNFPNSLRFLKWKGYPGRSLPQTFRANKLVGLELRGSNIMQLWESGERKVLSNLRFLDLSESKLRTLDLGMSPNLERLNLYGCCDLTRLDVHEGCLKRVAYLDLGGCLSFESSLFIQQLESLELPLFPKLEVTVDLLNKEDWSEESSLTEEMSLGESLTEESSAEDWHEESLTEEYLTEDLPTLKLKCVYSEEQTSLLHGTQKSVALELQPSTKLESVYGSFFGLQHLTHLTIEGRISELPSDLARLVNLEELKLVATRINRLPNTIFMMKNLKSLKLEECHFIRELPTDVGLFVCLEKLTLSSKRIKHLPNSICMMKNLKYLQLFCELLKELPGDVDRLVCLEKLKLASERIKRFPDSICMMKNLRSLKLENCDFEELPTDLGRLICLEKLTLWSKRIKHLPDSICMMTNLKSLKLLYCHRLKELPRDLGQLVCLEKLNLYSAEIKHLPNSICMMTNLKSLKLSHCRGLKELPRDLGRLACLEELMMSFARIKHLPDSICMMKNLKSLKLEFCERLEELPREVGQLECLEELILSDCKSLKGIPNSICSMKHLKVLNISCTGISHLPQSIYFLEGLRVFGSEEDLQSCFSATEIHISEFGKLFCYIEAIDNTEGGTGFENQFAEMFSNRSCDRENPPMTTEPNETVMETSTSTHQPKPLIVYLRKSKRGQKGVSKP